MGVRRLAVSSPAANTNTNLYVANNQLLMSVIATNTASTSSDIRIWVEPSGSSSSSQYAYMVYDIDVDAGNAYETFRFAVNQNDTIRVRTSQNGTSFVAYGIIQYDVNLGAGISSYSSASPSDTVDGLIWVDSDQVAANGAKVAYVWDSASAAWVEFVGGIGVPLQSSAPASPSSGDLWIDNTVPSAPQLKVYNGTSWVALGSAVDDDQLVLAQRMFA